MSLVDWGTVKTGSNMGLANLGETDEERKKREEEQKKRLGGVVDWSKVKGSGKNANTYNFTPSEVQQGIEAEAQRWADTKAQEEAMKPKKSYSEQLWSNIQDGFSKLKGYQLPDMKIMAAIAPAMYPAARAVNYIQDPSKLKGDVNEAIDMARAFTTRFAGTVGLTLTHLGKNPQTEYQPQGKFEETLLGKEKVKDVWGKGQDALKYLGVKPEIANKYSFPVGLALLALDAPLFGGGKGKILEEFAGTKTIEEALQVAQKFNMNLDMVKLEALAKAQTPREVENIIGGTLNKLLAKPAEEAVGGNATTKAETPLKTQPSEPGIVPETTKAPGQVAPGTKTPVETQFPEFSKMPVVGQSGKELEGSVSALQSDVKKLENEKSFNTDNLNISEQGKQVIDQTIESIKPDIERIVGKPLSNDEMVELANKTQNIMRRAVGRDETLRWQAAMFNTRRQLAEQAESGTVTRDFIDNLKASKTMGTDIARKLQSLAKTADPSDTNMQAIVEAVLKFNDNTDEILKAAEGVDFKDLNQATEFYRKFISPKTSEWVDLIRYNSMLTNPLTHIVNITSNLINTGIVAPLEKLTTGAIDFLGSAVAGRERKYFAGEGIAHVAGYFKGINQAYDNFTGVMAGRRGYTNLDIKNIPVATQGIKGAIAKGLSFSLRLLEGMDQFFMALGESGEMAGLNYRMSKGIDVVNPELKAQAESSYRLFRQELKSPNQGHLLDAVDTITKTIFSLRESKNPVVSYIAKFTAPFVKTPMNIFKQGLEYSPVGFATIPGSVNKTEQLSKAIIGSAVFGGTATLMQSGRLTWAEPTGEKQKNEFRSQGKIPYAVKIGDTWISYQKLPPPLAFPLAMTACIDDVMNNKKVDDNFVDLVLRSVANYGTFLSDQSYAKSFGDLLTAVKGGESSIAQLVSNYAQQMIPMRAFSSWMARLVDDYQRKPDKDANVIDKQVQYLMLQIPWVSQGVPVRTDSSGKSIESQNKVLNSFSPFRVSQEKKVNFDEYLQNAKQQIKQLAGSKNPNDKRKITEVKQGIVEKKLGLTDKEKKFRGMEVYSGERAKNIFAYIKDMDNNTATETLKKLRKTNILTDEVLKQVKELIKSNKLNQ